MSPSDFGLPPSSHLVSSPTPPRPAGRAARTSPAVRTALGGCAALAMGILLVWELVASISSTVAVRPSALGTGQAALPSAAAGKGLPVGTGETTRPRGRPAAQVRRPERPRAAVTDPAPGHAPDPATGHASDPPTDPGTGHAPPVHPGHPVHHHPRPRHRPATTHATPGWVRAECLRRFGHDAARRMACEAALTQLFGH